MTSTSTLEMLNQELEGETHAIARYKENIAQAEALGEYGLHCILKISYCRERRINATCCLC